LGDIHYFQAQYAEAEAAYRRALPRATSEPRVLISVQNNLAWILAHTKGKEAEALALIGRALEAQGPVVQLLDTRGMVYLKLGRIEPATADLEKAVRANPEIPSRQLHLALAYLTAGRREEAAAALRKAVQGGLEPAKLDPLDRSTHEQILAALAKK
jgi:tetratricopeptide (TPR) repeat protein